MKKTNENLVILITLFAISIVIANVTGARTITTGLHIGPIELALSGGAITYAVTFLCTDIIGEIWGKATAQRVVKYGFIGQIFATACIMLTGVFPATDVVMDNAYQTLLGQNWIFVIGSLSAYLVSQSWDVAVFHAIRDRYIAKHGSTKGGRWLWNNGSTITSQIWDTVIYAVISFGFGLGWVHTHEGRMQLIGIIIGQYLLKACLALLDRKNQNLRKGLNWMKDIQVFTALDAKTVAAEKLDILLLSTEGAADMAIYNDLEKLKAAFPGKKVAAMADKMFNQDNTLADTLIRKVRVAGIENPQNVGGTASRIEIAFGENMPTETLEASTAYYAKIGGKTVVEITTSEEVPVDCTGLAKLFAGTSFEEDGVKFTAAVDDNTVTYTSTTRTAVSGYAESISLYKDADCFEDMGLSGAVVSVSVGKADTTKAENLIAAIEDLRDHNDDWYFILTDVTDPVCVTALCKWAESTEPTEAALGAGVEDHRKFYFGQTNDKEYVNEYGRSVVTYADNLAEWADAAWVGSVGPFWPESVTWKWKVPDGVSVADLRDSERDLLEENRVNFMTAEYKHEYMKNGICGDGNFIDNVLGADYITHQIRENLYEIFIANKKIAYTDDGFALVAAGVFAALNRAVELHIIATDPEDDTGVYTVVIPKRADATDEQARNRQMPDIKWSAQLEGAVHSVKVNGTLRVTLNG